MNVEHLRDTQEVLVSYLQDNGYSHSYVVKIKRALNFILSNPNNNWDSYEDAFDEYDSGKGCSYSKQRKSNMSIIANFDINGVLPGHGHHPQIRHTLTNYEMLNCNFKTLVDRYSGFIGKGDLKDSTVKGRTSMAASLLHKLQMSGCDDLACVNENQMIDVFCSGNKKMRTEYRSIMRQLILLLECDSKDSIRIISYIPKGNDPRKNKAFLSADESSALRDVIQNSPQINLRDRAIGALLFYTGLRCVDIANLRLDSVDFDNDVISIIQEKTDVPLCLPLRASFGNHLFDYIENGRPASELPYVFLSLKSPHQKITPRLVSGGIANKLYDAANIRMGEDDKRGGHLFRSHLTTTMVENEVKRPVISAVMGHEKETSIEPYLGIDFVHLKACALSVEEFPIAEEVFAL